MSIWQFDSILNDSHYWFIIMSIIFCGVIVLCHSSIKVLCRILWLLFLSTSKAYSSEDYTYEPCTSNQSPCNDSCQCYFCAISSLIFIIFEILIFITWSFSWKMWKILVTSMLRLIAVRLIGFMTYNMLTQQTMHMIFTDEKIAFHIDVALIIWHIFWLQ